MTEQNKPRHAAVLVTGAARGLGAAMAEALAGRGLEPILLGRSRESLDHTRERIERTLGSAVRAVAADVADWQSVKRAIDSVLAPGETLGGLINNAGVIDPIAHVEDSDPAQFAANIQVNLIGAYHVLRACLPRMTPGGVIVNMSSGAAQAEHTGWSAYAASKAALERLSATLAAERPDLRVYAIRPGVTDTGMQETIRASSVDNAIRRLPRDKLQPAEVPARAIAALFGENASTTTARVFEAAAIAPLDSHEV